MRSLCLGLLLLSACKMPRAIGAGGETAAPVDPHAPVVAAGSSSTLGSGDLLEVRVFQETDLSGAFRVSPEGTIDFPLCGKVMVGGHTPSQAADTITECLKNGFLKRPQVTVLTREYTSKKIFILGEVQKPGTFPYEENMSIIQAVTLSGGFTKVASKNGTSVTRIVDGQEKKIRVAVDDIGQGREKNFQLQPGDIIFVPESFF